QRRRVGTQRPLDRTERTLVRRVAIFAGGFTLDAAEVVCTGDDLDALPGADDVYLSLTELVSKSLRVFDGDRARYRLLEPVRQFAREQLELTAEFDDLARRHANWA